MNIYVSNLSGEITESELGQAFGTFGQVKHVVIMCVESTRGSDAGRFGYVEMAIKSEGITAMRSLQGTRIGGRVVNLVEALPLSGTRAGPPRKLRGQTHRSFGLNKIV